MAKKLYDLSIEHVALVDRPANKRKLLIIKAAKAEPESIKEKTQKGAAMLTKEQLAKIADSEIQEAVMTQQEEIISLQKKLTDLEKSASGGSGGGKDEEIWKNVPPAIRNRFEAMEREKEAALKKAQDEKDERETAKWVEKCKSYTYLQVVPQHFGKVLKSVESHCPREVVSEIERVFDTAQDMIAKGSVFSEYGKSNTSRISDATNVTARVQALADDYRTLDKNLDETSALNKVFREHPEWYSAWKRDSQVKINAQ